MNGGYKLVDFKNILISTTSEVEISGVHNAILISYGKPIIAHGVNIAGYYKGDFFCNPKFDSTGAYIELYISPNLYLNLNGDKVKVVDTTSAGTEG